MSTAKSMQYDAARKDIRPGDLIAFSHEGWSSWSDIESQLVRMFTRSEFSHVGIAWPVGGRVMILEAVVPAIRIFPLSSLLPFYWMPVKAKWTLDVEEYALARVGEKYSKLEAIKGFFGATKSDKKWQCAEYAKSVLHRAGIATGCQDTPTALVQEIMGTGVPMYLVTR